MLAGHEFALIDWIRRRTRSDPRVALGIGDDAALLSFPEAAGCLIAVDMLLEGVHFIVSEATPRQIGRKALGVNLSDIAAMAGRPLAAVVSVALPRRYGSEFARELHAGLLALADEFEVSLVGGDTNIWDGPLAVSVTVLGEAVAGRAGGAVSRGGARAGDWILVTGELGGSLAGKHLDFTPRVREALQLHEAAALHAMIDLSDGLAADLGHILDESGVGAIVDADAIPISEAAKQAGDGRSPLEHALGDGEDFELLMTVSPGEAHRLLEQPPGGMRLSKIGEVTAARERWVRHADATLAPLVHSGWEHRF